MSNMKNFARSRGITYAMLAQLLGQSHASICQKMNGKTPWQYKDRKRLKDLYGLSSDFIDDFSSDVDVEGD